MHTVYLEEENLEALEIFLGIAHLQFQRVPATISDKELRHLATLCDKYDLLNVLSDSFQK